VPQQLSYKLSHLKGEKVMIEQSCYYLNNKKYVSSILGLDGLMEEVASFYSNSSSQRKVVIVGHGDDTIFEGSFKNTVHDTVKKYNPIIDDAGISEIVSFKSYAEADNLDYLNNPDKVFMLFTDETDMLRVYLKYSDWLLSGVADYTSDVLTDLSTRVMQRDIEFATNTALTVALVGSTVETMFADEDRYESSGTIAPGKFWSYDVLFYMQDHMSGNTVSAGILAEKYAIHSSKLVGEAIQSTISRSSIISPLVGIVDYLVAQGDTTYTRESFIQSIWYQENNTLVLYTLRDFIAYVGTVDGLVDKLKNHQSWEYYDIYFDLQHSLPILVNFLEGTSVDSIDKTDVEFFHRRMKRIPYIFWTVEPLI